jgi:hypothetical protein
MRVIRVTSTMERGLVCDSVKVKPAVQDDCRYKCHGLLIALVARDLALAMTLLQAHVLCF